MPDGDYPAFLERYTGKHYPAGDFLDETGRVVGKHRGAVCYTLGQRKGLGLAMGAPVYVCGKDMEKNTVTVGPNEALFSSALRGNNWVWYPFPELTEPVRVTVKTRHSQTEQPGTVYPGSGRLRPGGIRRPPARRHPRSGGGGVSGRPGGRRRHHHGSNPINSYTLPSPIGRWQRICYFLCFLSSGL